MNTRPRRGTAAAIIDVIAQMPGITPREIYQLMEDRHRPKRYEQLSGAVSSLYSSGRLIREEGPGSGGNKTYKYSINPDPKPVTVERKRKVPTNAGYEATIAELKAKIRELTDWQSDAIRRYPDLAVPPTVIQARKIVAERLRASGDTNGSREVLSGHRDSTMLVQAVVDALELVA